MVIPSPVLKVREWLLFVDQLAALFLVISPHADEAAAVNEAVWHAQRCRLSS